MSEATTTQSTPASTSTWCVYSPDVDIYEDEHELLIIADVPGTSAERVSVDLDSSVLTIAAELPAQNECRTSYRRQFKLAVPVDPENISAELKSGELRIRLGRSDVRQPRRIDVKAS